MFLTARCCAVVLWNMKWRLAIASVCMIYLFCWTHICSLSVCSLSTDSNCFPDIWYITEIILIAWALKIEQGFVCLVDWEIKVEHHFALMFSQPQRVVLWLVFVSTFCFCLTWQFNQFVLLVQALIIFTLDCLDFFTAEQVTLKHTYWRPSTFWSSCEVGYSFPSLCRWSLCTWCRCWVCYWCGYCSFAILWFWVLWCSASLCLLSSSNTSRSVYTTVHELKWLKLEK